MLEHWNIKASSNLLSGYTGGYPDATKSGLSSGLLPRLDPAHGSGEKKVGRRGDGRALQFEKTLLLAGGWRSDTLPSRANLLSGGGLVFIRKLWKI